MAFVIAVPDTLHLWDLLLTFFNFRQKKIGICYVLLIFWGGVGAGLFFFSLPPYSLFFF